MRNLKKNTFGYVALALTLAIVVGSTVVLMDRNSTAGAEAVTLTENATVVASPFTEAVQKVHGSVVGVNNYTTYRPNNYSNGFGFGFGFSDPFGFGTPYGGSDEPEGDTSRQVLRGSGSGVVVAKGYVLTNYHVVEGAATLEVTSGDKVYPAELKGTDEAKDIAVLHVPDMDIEPVVLGDSDKLNVGDWAICIGNPLSFTGTTTVGIISALNREIKSNATDAYGKRGSNTMIQTDAAINSGNSGGGMFNVAGELVGVPSMKYTGSAYSTATVEGIGMAIPINEAKPLLTAVLEGHGNVEATADTTVNDSITSGNRPRIGVTVTNMNTKSYALVNGLLPNGAYVTEVEAGSPAEKAGIAVGDIIVEVDGTIVTNTTQMISLLREKQVGETAAVKVYRVEGGLEGIEDQSKIPEGQYLDLTVELAMLDNVQQ